MAYSVLSYILVLNSALMNLGDFVGDLAGTALKPHGTNTRKCVGDIHSTVAIAGGAWNVRAPRHRRCDQRSGVRAEHRHVAVYLRVGVKTGADSILVAFHSTPSAQRSCMLSEVIRCAVVPAGALEGHPAGSLSGRRHRERRAVGVLLSFFVALSMKQFRVAPEPWGAVGLCGHMVSSCLLSCRAM